MKVAFISSPYRSSTVRGIVENIRRAEEVALRYWKDGWAVFCPHKNTALFDGALPDHVWLDGDIEILKRCDAIVMCRGWTTSIGCASELKIAEELGLEIIYEAHI